MDLSVIIPAFNEERKIAGDVSAALAFFTEAGLDGEVIVVSDGSSDSTAAEAAKAGGSSGKVRIVKYAENRGKGHAVRSGMAESSGEFVMFADSGLTVPFRFARTGIGMIESGLCDVACGSRKLPGSELVIRQPLHRRAFSGIFRFAARTYLGVPEGFTDTQCGFKIYRGDVGRDLFANSTLDGFLFEIEIILRALSEGMRIVEFPVEWTCDRDTRISVTRTPLKIIREMKAIRRMRL